MRYSVISPDFGSSFPMYPLKMAANQMFPCLSATRPCGPESGVLSGYSRNCPVFGSSRPSLLAICSVTQSAPSGLTAGSCGRALGVGTSYSLMDTFSAPIEASSIAVTSSVSETVRLRRPIVFSSLEIDRVNWNILLRLFDADRESLARTRNRPLERSLHAIDITIILIIDLRGIAAKRRLSITNDAGGRTPKAHSGKILRPNTRNTLYQSFAARHIIARTLGACHEIPACCSLVSRSHPHDIQFRPRPSWIGKRKNASSNRQEHAFNVAATTKHT